MCVCVCVCERASHVYCVRRVLKHTHTHTHTHAHTHNQGQMPVSCYNSPPSLHPSSPSRLSLSASLRVHAAVFTYKKVPLWRAFHHQGRTTQTADVSSEVFLTRWKFKKTPTCMFMFLKDTFFKMNVWIFYRLLRDTTESPWATLYRGLFLCVMP